MSIKIGDIIASQIEMKDLKQKEVARALNIPYSTFNNYVCNVRLPDIQTTLQICKFLDIDLNAIYDIQNKNELALNKKEAKLIHSFRSVNDDFQDKLVEVVQNLIDTLYEK